MKYLDKVKVISNKYLNEGIKEGDVGEICLSEIRDNEFYVRFERDDYWNFYDYCMIKIEDLEFVEDGGITDEELLKDLPKNDPRWWCKVENGFILNLLGEKKNKIPYDYNS